VCEGLENFVNVYTRHRGNVARADHFNQTKHLTVRRPLLQLDLTPIMTAWACQNEKNENPALDFFRHIKQHMSPMSYQDQQPSNPFKVPFFQPLEPTYEFY